MKPGSRLAKSPRHRPAGPPRASGAGAVTEVAAGLVFRRGRLLITQRRPQDHLGGLWEFPGGKREPAESFPDCLRRELREELGIEVEVDGLFESVTHAYPQKTVHLRFFRCRWRRHEPVPLGCRAFAWIGPAELARYAFPPADARLLHRLRTEPGLWRENRALKPALKPGRRIPRRRAGNCCPPV